METGSTEFVDPTKFVGRISLSAETLHILSAAKFYCSPGVGAGSKNVSLASGSIEHCLQGGDGAWEAGESQV